MTSVDQSPIDFDSATVTVDIDIDLLLVRGRRRRFRRRATVLSTCTVVLAGCVGGAVLVHFTGRHGSVQSLVQTPAVPCDTPTRAVPDYLDWPCVTAPVSPQYDYLLTDLGRLLKSATVDLKTPQVRVLAVGELPNGSPGSKALIAQYWDKTSGAPAQLALLESDNPNGYAFTGGATPASDPPLLSTPANESCTQVASAPTNEAVTCTNTVVVKAGVTAVELVRGTHHDQPVPVTSRLAGIYEAPRWTHYIKTHWKIEALNATGQVVGSIPYTAAF